MTTNTIVAAAVCVAAMLTQSQSWVQSFDVDLKELATSGESRYFILTPGYQLTLEGQNGRHPATLVVTVLDETKEIGGVMTRVVEERETHGGELAEVSRNYFAIRPSTGDIYYFGEDVDTYRHGKISGHEGVWHHDSAGARFGLLIPGHPTVGQRFYQELAPKVAMDRAEVVSVDERVSTPAGTFEHCLKTRETTPLELFSGEFKLYAPGVGLVRDGPLSLTSRRTRRDK
jgi:hypothetical protein